MESSKLVMVAVLALAGCANLGAGGGGRVEVLSSGAETIRMRWDSGVTSEQAVRSTARAYCSGRDADAVDATPEASGALRTQTWRCKPATGSGASM